MTKEYSHAQLKFLHALVQTDISLDQIVNKFNAKFKQVRTKEGIQKKLQLLGWNKLSPNYQDSVVLRNQITQNFVKFVRENKYIPTQQQFTDKFNHSPSTITRQFGSFSTLEKIAKEKFPKVFAEIVDESTFSEETFTDLQKSLSVYRRFVITTAVTGCKPHEAGLKALQSYCKRNNAKLLVLPCSDPAKIKEHKYQFSLHHDIPNDSVVFGDLKLNSNLIVSTIKLSAKQLNPLTGLVRLGNKGSIILASPKQMLVHVANSNKQAIPRAVMTTGAITVSDYRTEMYMSERLAYLANEDHMLGAVIVEIEDDRTFYYRRIQIKPDGSFSDLDKKYLANGKVEKITAKLVNLPDWHCGNEDSKFKLVAEEIVRKVQPEIITLEDFFDGSSINPHEKKLVALRSQRWSLWEELEYGVDQLDQILSWGDFSVVFKYGNHEDFLTKWLMSAEYAKDAQNHQAGVTLAKHLLEGKMPIETFFKSMFPECLDRITFLRVNDSFIVDGIENGAHGHLGSNGKRNPTLAGLEGYGACTVGHSHSAGIFRNVVRVGTATKLQLSYNDGASAWTQTLCIQHRDGARQLITVINGKYCLPDILQ